MDNTEVYLRYGEFYEEIPEEISKTTNKICVVLNGNCNLNCEYCYIQALNKTIDTSLDNSYNLDSIFNCLDKIVSRLRGRVLFITAAGENLLVKKDLFKLYDKLYSYKNIVPELELTTNGLLLDKEVLEKLKNYNVRIKYSFDGYKSTRYKLDKGDCDIEFKQRLQELLQYPFTIINMTITKPTVDRFEESLKEVVSVGHRHINVMFADPYPELEDIIKVFSTIKNVYDSYKDIYLYPYLVSSPEYHEVLIDQNGISYCMDYRFLVNNMGTSQYDNLKKNYLFRRIAELFLSEFDIRS